MAYVNEIQVGRLNGILHKLLDMKEGAPAPQLAGDIQTALVLENDRPEWKFLGGERLAWGNAQFNAVAAEYGHVQLLNPADSGMLVVLEKFFVSGTANSTWWAGHLDTALSAGLEGAHGYRDGRLPRAATQSTAIVYYETYAASQITSILWRGASSGTELQQVKFPIVLSPGTGLCVQLQIVNVGGRVSFVWRERTLEPSEQR